MAFFATSHGKGPSDGLSGSIKRKASRANLQLTTNMQIQTADELCKWPNEHV